MRRRCRLLLLASLLAGCTSVAEAPRFTFARLGGVLRGAEIQEGAAVTARCGGEPRKVEAAAIRSALLLRFRWRPEERCAIRWGEGAGRVLEARAPLLADPVPLFTLDMKSVLPLRVDAGLANETSFLLFSPSGDRLAVGTRRGFVRVIEVESGKVLFRRRIAEGMAKSAAFSPGGRVLFIGEQTRDGFIRAFDLSSGRELWRHRLAGELETATPFDPTSTLAWVEYPGPYRMAVTPEGDLLVGALHVWRPGPDRSVRHLSHLYRFEGRTGALRWKWPADKPAPLKLTWFSTDAAMRRAVAILGSARPESEWGENPPGLYAVDLKSGKILWKYPFQPLRPYFQDVSTWRGVGVRPDGNLAGASTGDGRLFILEGGRLRWTEPRGGPVLVSGLPVVSETGSMAATRNFAVFLLGDGFIPLQAAPEGAASIAQAHPNRNAILFYDWSGRLRMRWPAPNRPNGVATSKDTRWLAVALSKSQNLRREDINGIVLFDTEAEGGRIYAGEFRTEGPVPFDQVALSPDGALIAVMEAPAAIPDGEPPLGKSRLHLLY